MHQAEAFEPGHVPVPVAALLHDGALDLLILKISVCIAEISILNKHLSPGRLPTKRDGEILFLFFYKRSACNRN